jgi:hypothetical protein
LTDLLESFETIQSCGDGSAIKSVANRITMALRPILETSGLDYSPGSLGTSAGSIENLKADHVVLAAF